ncbi:uncharacterized protein LOC134192419 [Corticium candelabrum]|uniref:uncharacterized protein LOC134192419 n=1 Tax=Corticium candelabrum TaxID=121492 RepID=UPI002E2692C6|nr:uncharacterized protein LOC134192419 [Corticium candelabrum]
MRMNTSDEARSRTNTTCHLDTRAMVEEVGKIFVGGLSWNTTDESLKQYFKQFGQISSCQIMRDQTTQKPRGFAFVQFTDAEAVKCVCDTNTPHILDGKQIDPKPALLQASSRGPMSTVAGNRLEKVKAGIPNMPMYQGDTKKIFIGGIAAGTMKEDIEHYFSSYGNVQDVVLMIDKQSQRPRGFGFVTLDSTDAVDMVVTAKYHQINGKTVEAKKAFPRPGEPGYIPNSTSPLTLTATRQNEYRGFNSTQSPYSPYQYGAAHPGLSQAYGPVGSPQTYPGQPGQLSVYSQQPGMGTFPNQQYSSQTSRFPYANTTLEGSLQQMGGLSSQSSNYDPFSSSGTTQQQEQSHLLGAGFASQLGVRSSAFSNHDDHVAQRQQQILSQFTSSSTLSSSDPFSVAPNSTPLTEEQPFAGQPHAFSQQNAFSNEYSAIAGFRQDSSLSADGGGYGRGRFPGFPSDATEMTMDDESRKIFVGGLSWETTEDGIKKHFSQFGEVIHAQVMLDGITRRSRGFGFITFKDPETVNKALATGEHWLDKKKIDPKAAVARGQSSGKPKGQVVGSYEGRVKKIFVGGLSYNTTESDVRQYFSQYGEVLEIILMIDPSTKRMRGFGFVTFDSEDCVEEVCKEHFHSIKGKTVEAKKAVPRPGRDNPDGTSINPVKSAKSYPVAYDPVLVQGSMYPPPSMRGYGPPPGYYYVPTPTGYQTHVAPAPNMAPVPGPMSGQAPVPTASGVYHASPYPPGPYIGSPQIAYSSDTSVRYHTGSGPRHAGVMSPTVSLAPNTQHIHLSGGFPTMLSHHQHPGSYGDLASPTFVLGPPPVPIRGPHQSTVSAAGVQFVR